MMKWFEEQKGKMDNLLEGLSMANSYAFWVWFFTHPELHNLHISKLEKEGYVWPGNYEQYYTMLKGRSCPFCHQQGFKVIEPMKFQDTIISKIYCICELLQFIDKEYSIGSGYRRTSLSEIKLWAPNKDKTILEATKENIEMVQTFMNIPLGWWYLYGSYGSGKTMMLSAIKTKLRGLALYLTMESLSQLVFDAVGNHTLGALINEIANAEVLLLDDFGKEYPNQFLYSSVFAIIDRRYVRKGPMFITSNKSFNELRGSSIEEMRAIVDRVSDTSLTTVLVSKQPSWRQRE